MPAGIVFPTNLPVVSRPGHGDMFEEIRSAFEPEIGVSRRRNLMRKAPRIFDIQLDLSQAEFQEFDFWWQDTIKGGEEDFDIQLLNDDDTLVWYTVHVLEEYSADVTKTMDWLVSFKVRAKLDHFGTVRVSDTDQLMGAASIGVASATGALKVSTPFYGIGTVGVTAPAKFTVIGLRGTNEVGMYWLPRGRLGVGFGGATTVGIDTARGQLEVGP